MASSRMKQSKNDVFVGNIPYGTTEDQLHQIFSEAGRIVNIRTVVDHETGKAKGYAFVEFEDSATALSAIRNLNGYECNGRQLRVNYSSNNSLAKVADKSADKDEPIRTVKNVVNSMSIHEVYDIVAGMKELVEKEGEQAQQMLTSHPQVGEALMLLMVRLGMMKADQIPKRVEKEATATQSLPLLPPQAPSGGAPGRPPFPSGGAMPPQRLPQQQLPPAVPPPVQAQQHQQQYPPSYGQQPPPQVQQPHGMMVPPPYGSAHHYSPGGGSQPPPAQGHYAPPPMSVQQPPMSNWRQPPMQGGGGGGGYPPQQLHPHLPPDQQRAQYEYAMRQQQQQQHHQQHQRRY